MTSPTLNDSVPMRTRAKRAVREFKPALWLDGSRVPTTVLLNGGFEATTGDAFDSWSRSSTAVSIETTDVDSGTNSCKLLSTDGALVWVRQTAVLVIGKTYTVRFRGKRSDEGGGVAISAAAADIQFTLDATWKTYSSTFVAADTQILFKRTASGTHHFFLDNISCCLVPESPVDAKTAPAWTSRDISHVEFVNTAVAAHPVYTAATKSVTFAGTDDYLTKATPTLTSTSGRVIITCSTSDETHAQVLYSQSDTGGAADYLWLGISSDNMIWYKFDKGALTAVELKGSVPLGTGMHVLEWASDDSVITMFVDGSPVTIDAVGGTNAGQWFGDIDGANNSTIGASIDDTDTAESPFTGSIQEIVALEPDDTAANAGRLRKTLGRLSNVTLASAAALLLNDGAGFLLDGGTGLLLN